MQTGVGVRTQVNFRIDIKHVSISCNDRINRYRNLLFTSYALVTHYEHHLLQPDV